MVFGQISSKMKMREFSIFIIFSDAYTCSYVVYKVGADSDQNWIFLQIFEVAPKLGQRPCTIVQGLWVNFACYFSMFCMNPWPPGCIIIYCMILLLDIAASSL